MKTYVVLLTYLLGIAPAFRTDCDVNQLVADVVILMDASGSIGRTNFVKQVNVVKQLVDFFVLNVDKLQIGAVTFSSTVHTEFKLNRFARFHDDPATLKKYTLMTIDYITNNYESGSTQTAQALRYVIEHSFTKEEGDRPDAPNILIVMTDGASDDKVLTLREADNLRKHGITCIPIGIGNNKTLSLDELNRMASNESYVYIVQSYDALFSFLATMKKVICELATTRTSSQAPTATILPTTIKETLTSHQVSLYGSTIYTKMSGSTAAPHHQMKNGEHTTVSEKKANNEFVSDYRSFPALQTAEVTTIAVAGVVTVVIAVFCCRRMCLAATKRRKVDDEKRKVIQVKEISLSNPPKDC